jgi:hypothetical protein
MAYKHGQFLLLLATVITVPVARAQQSATMQTNPAAPIAPLPSDTGNERGNSAGGSPSGGSHPSQPAEPDTHLLSGAEIFSLGSLQGLIPIFDPALQFSQFAESGIVAGRYLSTSSVGGNLNVRQRWGRYHLTFGYRGAETIYKPSYEGVPNLPYHGAGMSQEMLLGRWTLRLRDDVLYSWASGFSGLFTGGLVQSGDGTLGGIQPSLGSSTTIQTALARQLNNTAAGEADYAFSRRTTVTVVGTYSSLHFLDPGYINSQVIDGRLGYTYALSAKNNIGVTYDHNRISYAGTSTRLETDLAQFAFGRKITGRLAFQASGGPQLLHFEQFGSAKPWQLSWNASTVLSYRPSRTSYSLSYFHGVTAGSGVFLGSSTESITASASRGITKFWSASVNGGYAINNALASIALFSQQFNDWFTGANFTRQIGSQVYLGLSYGFQQQTAGGGACPVISCGLPQSFSQAGVNLQWHPLAKAR